MINVCSLSTGSLFDFTRTQDAFSLLSFVEGVKFWL